ncbi:MAG: hypothetical protein ABRQ23_05435 [Syntrophomonadaceae bacterium]
MLNINRVRVTAIMTAVLSLLAFYASLRGVFYPQLYTDLLATGAITESLVAGSIAQDIISLPASAMLLLLSMYLLVRPVVKPLIAALGLAGYFLYGYGLYAFQGGYTSLYLIYLAIFSLSLYSLIVGLLSFRSEVLGGVDMPPRLRTAAAFFLLAILAILVPLWLVKISGPIAQHIPPDTYGVFVLDLGVIFPAFAIIAYLLMRRRPWGDVLAGVALIKILTLCFSVAFGEWFGPLYRQVSPDYTIMFIFIGLTLVSLALSWSYFRQMQIPDLG